MRKTFVLGLEGLWWVEHSQQPNAHTATCLPPSHVRQGESKCLCEYWLLAGVNPEQLSVLSVLY